MTDYELYQLLEENGYEPSEENLEYLKENMDLLNEWRPITRKGLGRQISKITNRVGRIDTALGDENISEHRRNVLHRQLKRAKNRLEKDNQRVASLIARDNTKAALAVKTGMEDQNKIEAEKNNAVTNLRQTMVDKDNKSILDNVRNTENKWNAGHKRYAKYQDDERVKAAMKQREEEAAKRKEEEAAKRKEEEAAKRKENKNPTEENPTGTLEESIDIIASLLESNGFEVTEENILTLCEDIANDSCAILDSSDVVLTEGMDPDYVYMQILDNNGFEVTEENIDVLKEALDNGHILLV